MRRSLCLFIFALGSAGCTRGALEAVEEACAGVAGRSESHLERSIDPDYADALGAKARLLDDVRALWRDFGRIDLITEELTVSKPDSALVALVKGGLDADLVGKPTWKVRGPMILELVRRSDGFRIRSGMLTAVRDIRAVMDARRSALEANDADAVRVLLHPGYRDGDMDVDDAHQRLQRDLADQKIRMNATNYRLELRGDLAHVDEHFILTINDRPTPPLVGRFTLKRSAGRWRIAAGLYPSSAK